MPISDSVIVSAVRTPTGKFLGSLKDFTAPQLGALVVREAVARAGIDPGASTSASWATSSRPARDRTRRGRRRSTAGSHDHVAAMTINKVCGSGLKAVMLAAQGIATGDIDVAVAGGMESMSNAPYLLPRVREGLRMGNGTLVDSMIHDGLWCAFDNCHMGMSGEARRRDVQRRARRAGSVRRREPSQGGARHARGLVQGRDRARRRSRRRREPPCVVDRDEAIREDTTAEALAALKPAFKKDGTVTAGNAPGVNDGAAALVVMAAENARRRSASRRWRASSARRRAAWRRSWC